MIRDMMTAKERLKNINSNLLVLKIEAAKEDIARGYAIVDNAADILQDAGMFSRVSKALIKLMH